MADYRRSDIDLSTRTTLALRMLDPTRPWGEVSQLAQSYRVPRKFLYALRDRAQQALGAALPAHPAGRPAWRESLVIDAPFLRRAMLILSTAVPGTVRGIQLALELLFDRHCAVGRISQTLQAGGQRAQQYNAKVTMPGPVLGEADEIFQARHPCLTVLDGRSFLVLHLAAAPDREGTTWGVTLLDLLARGLQFHDLACDGGTGLHKGMREASFPAPRCPDLFHLLRDGYQTTRLLEAAAYRAIAQAYRARSVEQEAQGPQRRRGPRRRRKVDYAQAYEQESQAIEHYEAWVWLLEEVHQALAPFDAHGKRNPLLQARQTLQTIAQLMISLGVARAKSFAHWQLLGHLEELLTPLAWLEQAMAPYEAALDADTGAFLVWVWQHQHELQVEVEDLPANLRQSAEGLWRTLALFHRASSLAEALHSWLRPYLQVHRGMPEWLLPLLQLFWNHHAFSRGQRQGQSPLELAGVEGVRSWAEVLDLLAEHPSSQ